MFAFRSAYYFLFMPWEYYVSSTEMIQNNFERQTQYDNVLPTQSYPYIQTTETFSLLRCLTVCNGLDACISVVYSPDLRKCKLLKCLLKSLDIFSPPSNEWIYLSKINGCPTEWMRYMDHCYLFEQIFLKWNNAKTFCSNKESFLVEINSKEEDDWIVEQIAMHSRGESENQYIGANSKAELGVWRWSSDNALITYNNVWPMQPNLYDSERCLLLDWNENGGTYKWADTRCPLSRKFICEKVL